MLFLDCHTHDDSRPHCAIFNAELNHRIHGWVSYGLHPWKTEDSLLINELKALLGQSNCLALGEVGLDRLRGPELPVQVKRFVQQLEINEIGQLPVLLHEVRAFEELVKIKQDFSSQTWVIHGFHKVKNIERALQDNFHFSLGRAILTKTDLQDALVNIPDERLLIESDMHEIELLDIYQKIASLKKMELLTLQQLIEHNFKRIFSKWNNGLSEQR